MTRDEIAFGFTAIDVALLSRRGILQQRERLRLVTEAYTRIPHDDRVREAVTSFLTASWVDPSAAGEQLQDFVISWTRSHGGAEGEVIPFDWQRRADING